MLSVEEYLAHTRYDAQRAHEYYERTKQLKGRKKGRSDKPAKGVTRGISPEANHKKHLAGRANTRAQELKVKLSELEKLLDKLIRQSKAKKSSASESSRTTKKTSNTSKSPSDRKPLTANQKEDARKRSKEWRDKHPEDQGDATDKKIAEVRAKIAEIRAKLEAAMQKARKTSNPAAK